MCWSIVLNMAEKLPAFRKLTISTRGKDNKTTGEQLNKAIYLWLTDKIKGQCGGECSVWWGVQHLRGETQKAFSQGDRGVGTEIEKKEALCEHLADILGWRDEKNSATLHVVQCWVCLRGRRKTSFCSSTVSDMVTSRTWSERSNLGHVWGAMERMLSFKEHWKHWKV